MLDSFISKIVAVIIASMTPVSEATGSIPLGIALGLNPWIVIPLATILNCLIFIPIYFALEMFYKKVLSKHPFFKNRIKQIEKKDRVYIEKYGIPGLFVFIAIPVPMTGAWTGTILAWIMRLDWKKSFLAITCGVIVNSAIVSGVVLGFLKVSPYIMSLLG